jgi:hypothetical protein
MQLERGIAQHALAPGLGRCIRRWLRVAVSEFLLLDGYIVSHILIYVLSCEASIFRDETKTIRVAVHVCRFDGIH